MTETDLGDWNAIDKLNASGNRLTYGRRAKRARSRVPSLANDEIMYTREDRIQRRASSKRARQEQRRLLGRVRRAMRSGEQSRIIVAVENYLRSYSAKLCAYAAAWGAMKDVHRPHIAALSVFASQLDPYKLELEEASARFERKSGAQDEYRQIVSFGIHHRARQHLVLNLLKVCFGELRDDQFQQRGKGRDAAVQAAIQQMQYSQNEFVAEYDIESFFPTIGEKDGRMSPTNILHEQLHMLPRAVVESSVLSSGVLMRTSGGAALSRNLLDRIGVPQGSALSSFLSEYIVGQIMSEAETLALCGQVMIAYCDNIAVFGQGREDVNSLAEPLVSAARCSPYGAFRLRRTQSTRHISQGFIYLGYRLKWHSEGRTSYVEVDVADRKKEQFQAKIAELLPHCRFTRNVARDEREQAIQEVKGYVLGWAEAFKRADDIKGLVRELLEEVLYEEAAATQFAFRSILRSLT
ncbi:hypothetical protein K4L05_02275 [Phaeobacter inhibens]|uniref:reverse transcriptase domain-containing protein n=1 Tax=Phaeobacter inhibens TaxID=221822 RepID=UPI0021A4E3D5|nr:reverse transcriptase domain-containing protein [Phaeobacter inhibens]UWR84923.1 hypothetical protein K4L05_02275 [Phaeobacter inhibens]